jgi:hypothetical protein
VRLKANLDWSPGGTPDLPFAVLTPRMEEVEVSAGFKVESGSVFLNLEVDGSEICTFDRYVHSYAFCLTPYTLSYWIKDALALAPGEKEKVKGRWVTRMTEDELRTLEPIPITRMNNH